MRKVILLAIALSYLSTAFGQLGIGTERPNPSASLDIVSKDSSKGVLFPRMNTAQRNQIQVDNRVIGLMIFNTDKLCLEVYLGVGALRADPEGWDDYCSHVDTNIKSIGVDEPDKSAAFELKSQSKGVLFPRMNTAQRDAIQELVLGLTIFNTDSLCYQAYRGKNESPQWYDYCHNRDPKLPSLRIGTDRLDPSAIASIASTDKGVLLPRMTTKQRNLIQSPVAGLTIFNLDSLCYQVYIGNGSPRADASGWDDYCDQGLLHSLRIGVDVLPASAIVSIASTAKGILLPRLTTDQRNAIKNPAAGLTIFNLDSLCYQAYVGTGQPKLADASGWDDYCVQTYYDSLLIGQGQLDPSATLQVKSTSKGVLLPRMNTAQRDSIQNPALGLTIFNLDSLCYEVYRRAGAQPPWDDYCKRKDPKLASLRIGTDALDSSAIVSVSSRAKGVLLPRMNTAQRAAIQNPASGLTIFNLDSLCYQVYLNGAIGWDDYCHRQRLNSLVVGSDSLDSSAILEISATDKGVLLPRMTTAQRDSTQNPAAGLMIFNTDSLCYQVYVGLNQPKLADASGWDDYCVKTYYDSLLIGSGQLASSAVLEVKSTSKGVLLPRLTTDQRNAIGNPVVGLTIFNLDSSCYEVYLQSKIWDDYCKRRDPKLAFLRIGTDTLELSAIVSVSSTAKGVLLPRMNTAQRDSIQNPAAGLTIFNLDSLCYQVYLNSAIGWDNYCHRQRLNSLVVGSDSLDSSAILEISATDKGVLLPRLTTVQRDAIQGPAAGLMIFNTDSLCYQVYVGLNQPKLADASGWDDYCVKTYYDSLLLGSGSLAPSAVLEMKSTSKAVLFPRMNTAQRNAIQQPASGLTIFNLDSSCYEVYLQSKIWDDYCNRKDPKLASLRIGTDALEPSAIVSVSSTAKGVLLPRMNTAQRDSIQQPASGLTIFNTDSLCYQVYLNNAIGWDDYCHRQRLNSLVVGSDSLDSSAILEISATDKGVLLSSMNTAQRDSIQAPALGLMIFNVDSLCYQVYVGTNQPTLADDKGWDDYCVKTYYDSLLVGQGNMGGSAVLAVNSTDKGVRLPRLRTAQRDAIQKPVEGLTIFNVDSACYEVYLKSKGWDDYCARKNPRLNFLLVNAPSLNPAAIFQVDSKDKGVLFPRLTTAQRDAINNPALGLMIFNLDSSCYELYVDSKGWDNYCAHNKFHASLVDSLVVGDAVLASSALLQVISQDRGVIFPRMNTAVRDQIIATHGGAQLLGLTIFNTDSLCYQVYIGLGQPQADAAGWDDYCSQKHFDSLSVGTGSLDPAAIFQVNSDDKGVLFPRLTTVQRNGIAVNPKTSIGLTIFNTDSLCYEAYIGPGQARADTSGWYDYCMQRHLDSLLVGTGSLVSSAIFQVNSQDKGMLFPRMKTAQRSAIVSPSIGLTIFNTDSLCYEVYVGQGKAQADASGWDNYCVQKQADSLLVGTGDLNSSAILQVNSQDKGVLFPRMTTTQRDSIQTPIPGLMIFNITSNCYEVYGVSPPSAGGQGWSSTCEQVHFDSLLVGTGDLNPSAIFQVNSDDKGVLLPRLTTDQRNAINNPEEGLTIFNLDSLCYESYLGAGGQQPIWLEYCNLSGLSSLKIGTGDLNPSAIFQVNSDDKGVLLPRLTTDQRNAIKNPEIGLTIFNLDSPCYQIFIGVGQRNADDKGWDDYCHRYQLPELKVGVDELDNATILQIESTTRGVLFPRLTTIQRDQNIANPAIGLIIFNLDSFCYQAFIGRGAPQADASGWDDYCVQTYYDSLLIGEGDRQADARLEIKSTSKGVLLPRLTTKQRDEDIIGPEEGLTIFNTDSLCYQSYLKQDANKRPIWYDYCSLSGLDALAIGTGKVVNSAILQVDSKDKGVLFPRLTTKQRNENITDLVVGLTIFNLDSLCYQSYSGKDVNQQPIWLDYCKPRRLDSLRIGADTLHASAILQVDSKDKGVLLPRLTTAQRDSNITDPTIGLMIFNLDSLCYQVYVGKDKRRQPIWNDYCRRAQQPSLQIGTDALDPSAILQVGSDDKGVLLPRLTTAQRDSISNPVNGMIIFNSTEKCHQVYLDQVSGRAPFWDNYCNRSQLQVDSLKIGSGSIDASAALDIESTSQGVLFPRLTTAERDSISNPTPGLMIYNTSTDCHEFFSRLSGSGAGRWESYCKSGQGGHGSDPQSPGKSCYEIHKKDPAKPDGEYWIKPSFMQPPVKTYCDMTHGGFTLVWSYSEKTNYNDYPNPNSAIQSAQIALGADYPQNQNQAQSGGVIYTNFRMPLRYMRNLLFNNECRVRVANNPTDMNDNYALADYLHVKFPYKEKNFFMDSTISAGGTGIKDEIFTTQGIFLGDELLMKPGVRRLGIPVAFFNGDLITSPSWNSWKGGAATNFKWNNNPDIKSSKHYLDDVYFFGIPDTTPSLVADGVFGKCDRTITEKTNKAKYCESADLRINTAINSGEGRYLQWFVR